MPTISLDETAHELLEERRREGESISDVVKRLAGERSWNDVAGIWADDADELELAIEAGRDRSRRRDRLGDDA